MSPNSFDQINEISYKFQDENEHVVLTLYATGVVDRDFVVYQCETDSFDLTTPTGERWYFALYDHIDPERTEFRYEANQIKNQTTIEILLFKQNPQLWAQIHRLQTTPILPQKITNQDIEMIENKTISSTQQEQKYHCFAFKTLETSFQETLASITLKISIRSALDCNVKFTETNFTVTFSTDDEYFIEKHSIPSNTPIKIFVRVKERIKPSSCSYNVQYSFIEIQLAKENDFGPVWDQIEIKEYSDSHSLSQIGTSPVSSLSSTQRNSEINHSNRAIPLMAPQSINRSFDRNSFGPSCYQNNSTSYVEKLGFTGIYNPANSCFMNAALQCLSNTRELRDYFLELTYFSEINRTNPLGMKGEMAEEFAYVIKQLWNGNYSYIYANKLREFAAKRHQEFVGNGQHDAQELLTIVLDALHEDVNRIINKPQVPPIEDNNRSDHIVADEYWRGYLSRNDSIIVQLFTGQFKSKTKCPQCYKESVTFDPFTSISVPIPKRITMETIVLFRNEDKSPIKYRILMSADGTIQDLKRLLSDKCGLPIDKMFSYKIQTNNTIELLKDSEQLSTSCYSWSSYETVYISEILTSAECDDQQIKNFIFCQRVFKTFDYASKCAYCSAFPNPHRQQKICQKCFRATYCDDECEKFHAEEHRAKCEYLLSNNYEIIGHPFVISLPESKLTCKDVFEQIQIYAKRTADIHIERAQPTLSMNNVDSFGRIVEDEEESFSDIEDADWLTIESKLSSSDSWSICRIGDYFLKRNKNKRRHNQQNDRKEKILKKNRNLHDSNEDDDVLLNMNSDSSSDNSIDDFDTLDDIFDNQPLFRLMPHTKNDFNNNNHPIVLPSNDNDEILRNYSIFSVDWFTDNANEALLRVTAARNFNGINGLIYDESVSKFSNGDQDVTLQQCLQLFIEPEILGSDDKWFCPHCKEHIQAEKKMSIWRLPPILIIHLKRFKYSHYSSFGYMSSSREKIETSVKFPTYNLNMSPYCSSINEENQENDSLKSQYNLYGIINHRGTAWFGHYTSDAKLLSYNDSTKADFGWRHFDDEHVSEVKNENDFLQSDAYVLFYRHQNLEINIPAEILNQQISSESTNV